MTDLAFNSFVTFFVIIDPIGLIAIFNSLAAGLSAVEKQRLAVRGTSIGGGVLLLFALGGEHLLSALGISLPAFRAAGGALLFLTAMEMVSQRRTDRRGLSTQGAIAEPPDDPAIFPLGFPLIAGPGAITSVLLLMSRYHGALGAQALILAMMVAALAVTLATFLAADRLARVVGRTLAEIASRLLGVLLAAVAVSYMVVGIRQVWDAAG